MEKSGELILEIYNTHASAKKCLSIPLSQVSIALDALKPKTLDGVISNEPLPAETLYSQDFWRQLHASLKEERSVLLKHEIAETQDIASLAVMSGFAAFENKDGTIRAVKPAFKAGGTQLKKKKVESQSNPWGALATAGETINEDQLMKEIETKIEDVMGKYCGETDGIQAMKPCANCSCGLKEIYDAGQADAAQPVLPAESSCGKCYLGDAFRCGGCPYRGQPAFEAGDKLKLQNASVGEFSAKTEQVKIKEDQGKVVLEL